MRVLVVEDSREKIDRIIQLFNDLEITNFFIETDTQQAIKAAKSVKFDLLITDIVLAGNRGGVEMLLDLGRRNIRIPTIVYSFTLLSEASLKALREVNYSIEAQVMDSAVLKQIIQQKFV